MKRSYASPETSKLILRIHVREKGRVNLDPSHVELAKRVVQREPALVEAALQHRQRGAAVGAGQRSGLRHPGIGAGIGELEEQVTRQERHVYGDDDGELRRGRAQPRDESR